MTTPHFIYSKESPAYTWVTPAKAIMIDSTGITGQREVLQQRTTGMDRVSALNLQGAKPVSGPLVTNFWPLNIGTLFSTFLTDGAITTVTTGVYDHGLLYDDTAAMLAISAQLKYNATLGINVIGAAVNALSIKAVTKEPVKLEFDMLAKDEAKCGGTWDYDGSASPAVVASPTYAALLRPLMFYDAAVVMGGTPAFDNGTNKLSVGSGTSYTKLRSLSIDINHNLDADAYGLVQDMTLQEISPGNRDIEVSFDISWTDYATTFYDNARAGTAMALVLNLVGGVFASTYHYEAHIVIPSVYFNPVELPPLDGDHAGKLLTVTGAAQIDSTTGKDFGIWIRTSEATL